MTTLAVACPIPATSALQARLPGAHFHDCYCIEVSDTERTALGLFLQAVARTPAWVNGLMALRNRAVSLVGLKNLGHLGGIDTVKAEADYRPGDRVGIFTLIANTPDELLLGDRDRHLDVTLSLLRLPPAPDGRRSVALGTVVQVHNWLGHVYMLPVAPLHRRIVPAVLASLAS